MADIDVGTVEMVDPGRFWKSESEYIDWVTDNLDRLGEALELEFFDVQQGVKLGEHVVDIVAEADGVGRAVIECKLGTATMNHAGQLLAYAGAFDARVLVLIAPSLGEDFRAAAGWLNQAARDDVEVWAVEFQIVRIGDSEPAAHFLPVIRPSRFTESETLLPA